MPNPLAPSSAEDVHTPLVFQRFPRAVKWFTYGVTGASVVFLVFRADFGTKEHCFSGIRRWAQSNVDGFWKPSAQEEARLAKIDALVHGDIVNAAASPGRAHP